ncbi:CD48 antigen-like isoform X2 [Cyprinus carpio]|uniref:CD48 antigen-like isoform X2 n=1 Tax=Cyprinus carpio TaxID=7962 RepID=A0A9Q9VXI6_CYPCA|nr:CD48 antigen-like isoform X2 [Cyprinus carpio]
MTPLKYLTTLICFVFIAIRAASGEVRNEFGEVGGEVSFGSTSLNPSVSSIIWKHRSSTGPVVKAIEWDPAEDPDVSIPNPRFKDITTLNEKTGEITITNLTVEHSGFYTIDINSKEQEQRFSLTVMAPVPKPVIKIEKIEMNPNAVNLKCEYNETIIWKNSAGETLKGSPHTPKGELITAEKKGNPDVFYTCTLKNAVSESTSDPVYERDLFEESVPWWIALIVIPVLILAFVLLYKFWTKFHRKQYNLASEGNKMKEDAVSPVSMSLITDQKNVYKNGISDATQR